MPTGQAAVEAEVMNDNRQTKPTRLAPQQAIQEYLNTLLQDATAQASAALEPEVAAAVADDRPPRVPEVKVLDMPKAAQADAPVVAEVPVQTTPATEAVVTATSVPAEPDFEEQAGVVEPEAAADAWVDGRPPWAQQRFECLLFKVAGLTLAVPLVELGGVLVIDQELTPLFGQPDWFLGLLPSKTEGTVKVIDTARWVMPERCGEQADDALKYVVMMEGSEWGLACHEVADAITLEPHQVNWRSDRGRRPWLAGTVIEHMCAIMDVAALVRLVSEQSRPA